MPSIRVYKTATCKVCAIQFTYCAQSSGGVYCSNICQGKEKRDLVILAWLCGELPGMNNAGQLRIAIREYIKQRDGYKCVVCGWGMINPVSKKSPVEVDHIDGNHNNTIPSNLRTLCPNCHSLTATWKNTGGGGNGRVYRRITEES